MVPLYLDGNASTRLDGDVLAAMLPYLTEQYGNPSSKHGAGMRAGAAVLAARRQVQNLVGARADSEIVFTSGGTEADNMAILTALDNAAGRDEIVTTPVEHHAVLALLEHLEKTRGIVVRRVEVDSLGRIDLESWRSLMGPRTALACTMWANNETGNLHPVADLARIAHDAGALFFTDAVQAAGRVPIDVVAAGIDLLALSAHKFHGPKGAGALYVRYGLKAHQLLRGGRQERGRRAGTENVPAIVGLGDAAERAAERLESDSSRQRELRDRLQAGLRERLPGMTVLGDPDHRLANTLCVAFEGLESDDLVTLLAREGLWVSAGSACASGSMEPSHVLRAMKVPFDLARGAVRFSLTRETTPAEIDRALEVVPEVVDRLLSALQHRHVA